MKKLFTSVVVVLTITWAVGLAAFVPTAQAVALNSGDLIKASLPAVYYYGADAKRYVFPDVKTYMTWYSNFSSVKTITDTELAMISIGGNVTYRPGVKMLKINTDPKVYAVDKNGTLRWVKTEAIASCLYGSSWGTLVQDVSDAFFVNYTVGAEISDCSQYNKTAVMAASPDINADKGLAGGAAGNIVASLAADNPAGATIPKNATGVKVLKFNLSGTGTVTNLTFKSEGVGKTDDIANAYIYEGNTRLTSGKTFNTTTKEATFNTNISMSTHVLTLVIDVADDAVTYDEHAFKLLAINGEAIGGVMGNTFTIGAQSVSNVEIEAGSKPSNPKVGQEGALIANFKLSGGVNDAVVNFITLTQTGSINSEDLTNFVLKQAGNTVATAAGISSGDKILLVFNSPFSLLSGSTKTFSLYANVAGRPGRTINVYLDETQDLFVIDSLYGFGATVTNVDFDVDSMLITAEGGELTIAFNGPITGSVSKGAKDVTLFKFALTSAAPVEVKETIIQLDAAAGYLIGSGSPSNCANVDGTHYFTDIKLVDVDNSRVLAGPVSLTADNCSTNQVLTMNDDYAFDGTLNLAITADISNVEDVGGELVDNAYYVTLGNGGIFDGNGVKYQDSNDYVKVTDIVPNTDIAGNQQTVKASGLTVGVSTFIGDSAFVKGSVDDASVALTFKAGEDSDINIKKIVLTPLADYDRNGVFGETAGAEGDEFANVIATTVKLWQVVGDVWTQVGINRSIRNTANPAAVGSEIVEFENLNLIIPKGGSIMLVPSFNASNSAGIYAPDADIIFTIKQSSDIEAYDADENTVIAIEDTTGDVISLANANRVNNYVDFGGDTVISTIGEVGAFGLVEDTADTNFNTRLLQMDTAGSKALRVKATADYEDFKVTDAKFTIGGTMANVKQITVEYPTTFVNNVYGGYVSKTGDVNLSGEVTVSGMAWLVSSSQDSYATVTVKVNSSDYASSGANPFNVIMETNDTDLDPLGLFVTKAVGLSSGSNADANVIGDDDSQGKDLYARKTLLTIKTANDSPSDPAAVAGKATYLKLEVKNSTGGPAVIYGINFRAFGSDKGNADWVCSGGSLDGAFEVYNSLAESTDLVYDEWVTDSNCLGTIAADYADYYVRLSTDAGATNNGVTISAGQTIYLLVVTDTMDAAADDTFRIDVTTDSSDTAQDCTYTGGAIECLNWDDGMGVQNGYLVDLLPESGKGFKF